MPFDLPEAIRSVKKTLRWDLPTYVDAFREVESEMRRKVAEIVRVRAAGDPVIPIL